MLLKCIIMLSDLYLFSVVLLGAVACMMRPTAVLWWCLHSGGQAKAADKCDVDSETESLPPAGLVVKRTVKSVCTRSAVTRSKTGRKK